MRALVVVLGLALAASWALDEWRYRTFLKKAPWFWGTTPGSVRFANNGIMLVDDKTGHQTWIGPGSITFSGPGESIRWDDSDRDAHLRPQSFVRRMEIGVEKDGTIQARGLDMSDPRSILRYRQHVFNGEANPDSPAHALAARFDEEARRREAHLEARIAELERRNS
jgi:hypothetical protein